MTHPEKLDLRSHDIAEDKQQELLRLFPEIRTEGGKIDFERLQLALGEMIDVGKERYGMNWPGKADCFKTIQAPSLGTLLPQREESVNFDATENLIIEGDNLEVLKLLQKSYLGKVKMIYIDPPYNTGNDFIYPDNYTESLQTYLEYTGQVDAEGRKFSTNTEADGRFHSKWLNMMYPRLYLARNLLREDGVIFISIDDHEVENLRKLCNEIFGEENFLATIIWQKSYAPRNNAPFFSESHEYLLSYCRNLESTKIKRLAATEEQLSRYSNRDNDPRGDWKAGDLTVSLVSGQRGRTFQASGKGANLYEVVTPSGRRISPPPGRCWVYSKEKFDELSKDNRIWWGADGNNVPSLKRFLNEIAGGQVPETLWEYEQVGHTQEATKSLKELFTDADESAFPTPKPIRLIQQTLLTVTSNNDDEIILDFFAGSGTTAHAVLELNAQDHGNRKFILVQLPEPTGRKDFPTIADITKERVRRVIQKLAQSRRAAEKTPELNLGDSASPRETEPDLGFRVFKLAESNFKTWQANVDPGNTAALQNQLELHVDHVRQGRAEEDILYEILLKSGYSPTTPVETLTLAGKQVYSAQSGAFLICLARELTMELMRAMAERQPERVVCLDEGFSGNDQLKTNAVLIFKSKGATFKTV